MPYAASSVSIFPSSHFNSISQQQQLIQQNSVESGSVSLGDTANSEQLINIFRSQSRTADAESPYDSNHGMSYPPHLLLENTSFGCAPVPEHAEKNEKAHAKTRSKYAYDNEINVTASAESAIEEMAEDTRRVFEVYCSMGEPMNTTKLKSLKLMRMLKDMKLLRNGFVSTENSFSSARSG